MTAMAPARPMAKTSSNTETLGASVRLAVDDAAYVRACMALTELSFSKQVSQFVKDERTLFELPELMVQRLRKVAKDAGKTEREFVALLLTLRHDQIVRGEELPSAELASSSDPKRAGPSKKDIATALAALRKELEADGKTQLDTTLRFPLPEAAYLRSFGNNLTEAAADVIRNRRTFYGLPELMVERLRGEAVELAMPDRSYLVHLLMVAHDQILRGEAVAELEPRKASEGHKGSQESARTPRKRR